MWLFRITTDALFGETDFKNSEVAQFHIISRGEPFSDSFECQLNHAKNLLLGETGFIADCLDEIVLCKIWHKPSLIGSSDNFGKSLMKKFPINKHHSLADNTGYCKTQ